MLMALVLNENDNNVDERFMPCPAGLSGDSTLGVIVF